MEQGPRARARGSNAPLTVASNALETGPRCSLGAASPACHTWHRRVEHDGSYRIVVDLRALNEVTTKDHYPLPNITDALSKCGGYWFSTLDLLSGFDQVELDESSKEKTAFGTSFGLYQYERMTQGLTGAPATFQRLVDKVLAGLPAELVLSYIDDIITKTSSTDFYEHIADFDIVLTRLQQAGLTIAAAKVYIGFGRLVWLGYELGRDGVDLRSEPSWSGRVVLQVLFHTNRARRPPLLARVLLEDLEAVDLVLLYYYFSATVLLARSSPSLGQLSVRMASP